MGVLFLYGKKWGRPIIYYLVKLLTPIIMSQLFVWGYNSYRFHHPFDYGYQMLSFNTPVSEGLYGLILSPKKGLFIFSRVIILGIIGLFLLNPGVGQY
jgi:hypothetical protein